MRLKYLWLLIVVTVSVSCKKETGTIDASLPPQPAPAQRVLLKDLIVTGLPSPYYHFEYDDTGKVSSVSFASGFTTYNVIYNGSRIAELRNTTIGNNDKVQYFYDNEGRVTLVTYSDFAGEVYVRVHLAYEANKLVKLERERKLDAAFILNKALTMSYYADGNLKEMTYHFPPTPINGQTEATYTDHFEQYDDRVNVEGFSLLHSEFFDHLVFLPGIQLQRNNPGRETRTGDGINYVIDYTYTYNNLNAPLTRSGNFVFTDGPNTGQSIQLSSQYSYYP